MRTAIRTGDSRTRRRCPRTRSRASAIARTMATMTTAIAGPGPAGRRSSAPGAGGRGAEPRQPRSASVGMPIGATSTLPASALPTPGPQSGLRPVEGHREVRPDDRIGRVARGQVDGRRRVDGQDRHTARPGAPDQLDAARIGSRSCPRTPVPSRASMTSDAFSMPWPRMATSRATGACTVVIPSRRSSLRQFRVASVVAGDASRRRRGRRSRARPTRPAAGPRRSRHRRCCRVRRG